MAILKSKIDDALSLVVDQFRGVTDKDGQPYVLHCLRVMLGCDDPLAQQVGLMHDLVEDTAVTIDDLRSAGFDEAVVEAVDLVTHKPQDSYCDYVVRLKSNRLARAAKMADLRDNAGLHRVVLRAEKLDQDVQRIQKYIFSYQFLEDRIDEDTYRRHMQSLE